MTGQRVGIDYGLGQTNIDKDTGIRYGVINQNAVLQAWADSSEPVYPEPECKFHVHEKCPQDCPEDCDEHRIDLPEDCEPLGHRYGEEGYEAVSGEDGDIFIIRSPYYTYAQFCSPCAPGACFLMSPLDEEDWDCSDNRAYCFDTSWFDEEHPCPYPVFSVKTGERVA